MAVACDDPRWQRGTPPPPRTYQMEAPLKHPSTVPFLQSNLVAPPVNGDTMTCLLKLWWFLARIFPIGFHVWLFLAIGVFIYVLLWCGSFKSLLIVDSVYFGVIYLLRLSVASCYLGLVMVIIGAILFMALWCWLLVHYELWFGDVYTESVCSRQFLHWSHRYTSTNRRGMQYYHTTINAINRCTTATSLQI